MNSMLRVRLTETRHRERMFSRKGITIADIEAANCWREQYGYVGQGGVIVVYDGEGQGWVNELRNPESWKPGCVAVNESGGTWIATAGDDYSGAMVWVLSESSSSSVLL